MNYYVYRMISPTSKVYIGITDHVGRRLREHQRGPGKSIRTQVSFAIEKYGFEAMNFECIATAFSLEDAKYLEQQLIQYYDSYRKGYNATLGGDSSPLCAKLSEGEVEQIRRILEETTLSLNVIGDIYDVSDVTILEIQNNRRWRYSGGRMIERQHKDHNVGAENPQSKLNDELVREIKLALSRGVSRKSLQEKYNVSKTNIQMIATGQSWSHVDVGEYEYTKVRNGNTKLDEQKVRELIQDKIDGMTYKTLCEKYGVSRSTITNINSGKIWRDVSSTFEGFLK